MSENVAVKPMIYSSLFAAFIAIGAFIRIPIPGHVPITLQVFFVLLTGLVLGSRWGGISVLVYIMLGVIGLPVFSGGSSGIGVLLGPTGGYLIGFVLGAFTAGLISERFSQSLIVGAAAAVSGLMVIYLSGILQLSLVADMTIHQAAVIGILPFLPWDCIKIVAALITAKKIKPFIVIQ